MRAERDPSAARRSLADADRHAAVARRFPLLRVSARWVTGPKERVMRGRRLVVGAVVAGSLAGVGAGALAAGAADHPPGGAAQAAGSKRVLLGVLTGRNELTEAGARGAGDP